MGSDIELVDMKKTDGQMAVVNGIKVYTLYYLATKKYLTLVGGKNRAI